MKVIVLSGLVFLISICSHVAASGTPVAHAQGMKAAASSPGFTIIANDAGFKAPSTLSAGLRHIVLANHGSKIHEAMLVKLPEGMSAADYVDAIRHGALFPQGSLDYSGAGLTSPGESVEVWIKVDAGHYVLVCWNGDHATTVPVHAFTVVADGKPDDVPPKEDAVVQLIDFRFELHGTLKAGTRVVRVETPGPSMHEVDIFRLRGDSTVADVNRWRKREDAGKASETTGPADAVGGLLDSHDLHRVSWLRRYFRPGRYVLHCEMPMDPAATAGKVDVTHADVGMLREFVVGP
jgi:hypothetical protein